ncbi:MAG: CTAG/PCC1 family protein [Thermoplasmata archaeon]|nr:CTAG/PCC1 family protein [Thermoplasmata archaeon]
MSDARAWKAVVRIEGSTPAEADRLFRALGPEAEREVPRARAKLLRASVSTVELVIEANDSGALRAALNTYLGWVSLVASTEAQAAAGPG